MDLEGLSESIHRRLDEKNLARERVLPAARRAIRACADSIRAVHRGELDEAGRLIDRAKAAIDEGLVAVRDQPDLRFAGYLQDAQKEYAEACITRALVAGSRLPSPEELGVEDAPYLNGMAEAIGEARRHVLDLLRASGVDRAESVLGEMEDMYHVLASMDYPDAMTSNLRRSTDVARSLIEKTRGDLSVALVQRDLQNALDRHARDVLGKE